MLAGNRLTALPHALANCKNLELIRLAANRLDHLPNWLYQLPRLSWLAYAGNPFCQNTLAEQRTRSLPSIEPQTLQRGSVLGEGASGIIYQGTWTPKGTEQPSQTVAIKTFKGEMTSDGSPLDEMQACIAAGAHPNLVSLLGKIEPPHGIETERTATEQGLVFGFIPPEYKNLGGPPSLESCTRDTYLAHQTFTLSEILSIASGMASVLAHLHSNGILHGDFYAHNILINDTGHSILGDFGAASFYTRQECPPAAILPNNPLEPIEARAFGCLLEELLLRYDSTGDSPKPTRHSSQKIEAHTTLQQLKQIQTECFSQALSERPTFSHIAALLERHTHT